MMRFFYRTSLHNNLIQSDNLQFQQFIWGCKLRLVIVSGGKKYLLGFLGGSDQPFKLHRLNRSFSG